MNIQRGTLVALIGLAACAPAEAPPYVLHGDVQAVMLGVVEPAAEVYWDAVGTIIDQEGVHEIRPQNDEEWEAVRNAAFTVAEAGNLLMMEGRSLDDDAWMSFTQSMMAAAMAAMEAAETRDEAAVFDRGAELYYTCTACHQAYALETLRPNFEIDSTEGGGG